MTVTPATPGQPASLPWATGLPQTWIDAQWVLQRRILARMREFGMKPVLPAFQGNVPLALVSEVNSCSRLPPRRVFVCVCVCVCVCVDE